MKNLFYFTTIFLTIIFCSCETTRVYVKTNQLLYEDDLIVEENTSVTRFDYKEKDGQKIENKKDMGASSKHYYNDLSGSVEISNDGNTRVVHTIVAEKEKKSKASTKKEEVVFSLYESKISNAGTQNTLLTKKKMKINNGSIVMSSSQKDKVQFSGPVLKDKDGQLFENVSQNVINEIQNENLENNSKKKRTENYTEKITVISNSNSKYITYSFLGKPFVLLGASAWNILKCVGYAFINFAGGYNFTSGNSENDTYWMLPDYNSSKAKAKVAREANRIKYYPEYHIPFTDNKIILDKYDRFIEVENLFDEKSEKITAIEHQEYDNTMSVSLSAKADAASTSATANLIGTGITIPVSVITWLGGAAYGIYMQFKQ